MMIFHHRQDETTTFALETINLIFVIIFGIHTVLKAFDKGRTFFIKFSGIYQTFVILMAYINLIIQTFESDHNPNHFVDQTHQSYRIFNAVAKAMQFTLIIFVLNQSQKIKPVFKAIQNIMPILSSMVLLTFLYLYVYTIIAMNIFSYLKTQITVNGIDIHFRTFFISM